MFVFFLIAVHYEVTWTEVKSSLHDSVKWLLNRTENQMGILVSG